MAKRTKKEQEAIEEVKDATVETSDKETVEENENILPKTKANPEMPEVKEPKKETKKVKATYKHGLNVRKKPDIESEVVEVKPFNAEMEVTEEKSGFGKIKNGWIMLGFTKEIE